MDSKKDKCKDVECITKSYYLRIEQKKFLLLKKFSNQTTKCNSDPWVEVFEKVASLGDLRDNAKWLRISSGGDQDYFDIDANGDRDMQFTLAHDICRSTNCMIAKSLVLNVDGCFKTVGFTFNRSFSHPLTKQDERVKKAYSYGNFVEGFHILNSFIASGCDGSSGTRSYQAINKKSLKFETFASVDYECSKEVSFRGLYKKPSN